MAFVVVGNFTGYYLSATLVDNGGDKSTLTWELQAATSLDANSDATTILGALLLMSGSTIATYNVAQRWQENAFAYPVSGTQNQDKARLIVQLTGGLKKATIDIPAPLPAIFKAPTGKDADIIDPLNAAVLAYIALYGTGAQAAISDGELVDFMVEGRRVSSRKGFRG